MKTKVELNKIAVGQLWTTCHHDARGHATLKWCLITKLTYACPSYDIVHYVCNGIPDRVEMPNFAPSMKFFGWSLVCELDDDRMG